MTDISHNTKLRQDISGLIFIGMYVIDFVFQLLKFLGLVSPDLTWYITPMGIGAVISFVLLYSIASSSIGEIFTGCEIVLTGFFALILPVVLGGGKEEPRYYLILLNICLAFTMLSIYLWTILMRNGRFSTDELRWIIFLPMPYILDFVSWWSVIQEYNGITGNLSGWMVNNELYQLFSWALIMFASIGFWKLCHSKCFSGDDDDMSYPKWSPFNRYTISYAAAIVVVLALF